MAVRFWFGFMGLFFGCMIIGSCCFVAGLQLLSIAIPFCVKWIKIGIKRLINYVKSKRL